MELAIVEGLTQSEITVALKMPLDKVKSFMRRGFLAVREAMSTGHPAASPSILGTAATLYSQTLQAIAGEAPAPVA